MADLDPEANQEESLFDILMRLVQIDVNKQFEDEARKKFEAKLDELQGATDDLEKKVLLRRFVREVLPVIFPQRY